MDFEATILLLVSTQGLLLSLALILSIVKKNYSNFYLGLLLFVISIELLNAWGMQIQYHSSNHYFPFWTLGSYWIIPPAIFQFLKLNTTNNYQERSRNIWLFVPAGIEIITEFFTFYAYRLLGKSYYLSKSLLWFGFTEILPLIAMFAAIIFYSYRLYHINKSTLRINANKNWQHFLKLNSFFIVFALLTIFWFIQAILAIQVFVIIESLLIIFLFTLAFIRYFHPSFFDVSLLVKDQSTSVKYEKFDDKIALKQLQDCLEKERLYRKPKLSLKELSNQLALPTRYVSYLIHSYHQSDFRNFVNAYRVKEVIEKMQQPNEQHKTLLALAMESGFNSKSSFNHIFKNITGLSPSEYRNSSKNMILDVQN